jgi:uncharacterized membrane protein
MTFKKIDIIAIAAGGLSLAGLALILPGLPETIPTHWNFRSEADGWGPRWTILAMGALPLAIWLLMKAAPLIDPRRESYARHEKAYGILTAAISAALLPIPWFVAAAAKGIDIDVGILVRLVVGALLLVLGNFLGKLKQTYFVGIRTPWTLADPEVWRKTHRRGGYVFVVMGACMLASIAIPDAAAAAVFGIGPVILGVAYLFLYSYLLYRKSRGVEGR